MIFENPKEFFMGEASLKVDKTGKPTDRDLQIAAVAILVEMAYVDNDFSTPEEKYIILTLKEEFQLSKADAQELIEISALAMGQPERLHVFIDAINQNFSKAQRKHLMGLVWKLVVADGVVFYEEARLAMDFRKRLDLTLEEAVMAQQVAVLS